MMLSCDSYQQFPLLAAALHIDNGIAIVPRLVQLIIMHRLMATLCALQTHFRRPSMSAPIIGGPHVCKCNVYTPWGVARPKMFLLGTTNYQLIKQFALLLVIVIVIIISISCLVCSTKLWLQNFMKPFISLTARTRCP